MDAAGPPTERERVEAWRLETCLGLGLPVQLAERVAASPVDVHELGRLIRAGCAPETAADILL